MHGSCWPDYLHLWRAAICYCSVGVRMSRGYSLIECLIGICLIGLMSALSARFTQQTSIVLSEFVRTIDQRLAIAKSATVIAAAINSSERSRLAELLIFSEGSTLQTPHGGPHPLIGITSSSRPRSESSIISSIEVDPSFQGRIVESRRSTSGISVKVCGALSVPVPERFRSHILIGLGGLCQVTGSPQVLAAGCFEFQGTAIRGLLHNSQFCPNGSYHEFLPVSREISLFIDRSGEFRLASHVGMRLLENQPLARGLRQLKASLIIANKATHFINFSLRGTTTRELKFLLPVPLQRAPRWNEIIQ